jgi:hypothetical protein
MYYKRYARKFLQSSLLLSLVFAYSIVYPGICPEAEGQSASVSITGQYGTFVQLSAGTPPAAGGRTVSVADKGTGCVASGSQPNNQAFGSSIDFGDLSKGDGEECPATIGIRLRSNSAFRLVASMSSFRCRGLRFQGKDVTDQDGGTFVHVWAGALSTTGANAASPSSVSVNSSFTGGTTLATLARGGCTASSTLICAAPAASIGGTSNSPDNALELPIYVSVPTGMELGPAPGTASGTFSFTVQFGTYTGP